MGEEANMENFEYHTDVSDSNYDSLLPYAEIQNSGIELP